MGSEDPRKANSKPSREERLAKALRENLGRRKALVRAKRNRADAETADAAEDQNAATNPDEDLGS
jgi:hypothetical protein